MIVDVNAWLGHFAFRRLSPTTAGGLLKLMDIQGIDRAVVASASAITYRNPQPGNEDLASDLKPHRDRLIPFAIVNPAYAGWQDDLRESHEVLGMKGIRLLPGWHGYDLSDPRCLELVDAATERRMIVSIPIRIEDVRQRSWLVDVPEVALGKIETLVASRPQARFQLLNGINYLGTRLGMKEGKLASNYQIEISRLDSVLTNEMGRLLENVGAERLVFGSGMPFQGCAGPLLKVEVLEAADDIKQRIRGTNAAAWLDR